MDNGHGFLNQTEALGPLPVSDHEQEQMSDWPSTYGGSDCIAHIPVAALPLPPVPIAPKPVLPPRREWEDLAMLDPPAIMTHLHDLTMRCETARNALEDALACLKIFTHVFLSKHSPMSSEETVDYLNTFVTARTAGRNTFAPQEAYRSSLMTLGMLVADLIDVLPESDTKAKVRADFNEGTILADEKEEGIRNMMRRLADGKSKGREDLALAVYMDTAQQRLKNWSIMEIRFKEWAGECIDALLL